MWDRQLLSLHVVSDTLIWLSYLAISATLVYLVHKYRKTIPFGATLISFGVFIVACGFTHLMDVVVLWWPLYWLSGDIKLIAAIASVFTAVSFPILIPRIGELLEKARSSRTNYNRFLAASDSSNDSFFILDSVRDAAGEIVDFRFSWVNNNAASLVSQTRETLTGKLLCETFPVNRTEGFFDRYKHVVETGEMLIDEFPIDAPGINASWLSYQVVKLQDGVAISTSNVSKRKQAEAQAARTQAFTRSMIDNAPVAIIATGLNETITEFNPAAERMFGYGREEMIGKSSPHCLHVRGEIEARAASLTQELGEPIAPESVFTARPSRGRTEEGDWTYVRRDGSTFAGHLIVTALTGEAGERTGFLGFVYDITQRKRFEERISHLAHHDALTGLPNRSLLEDRLQALLRRERLDGDVFALLMLDLDNFKGINDSMGHHVGDKLLVAVADRIGRSLRKSDTAARMGGDEFVVLLDHLRSERDAEKIVKKLLEALAAPITLGGEIHQISASIGVCLHPSGGEDGEALLRNADTAMYHAKSEGRHMYKFFTPEMAAATLRKHVLDNVLQNAIARNEFELVYQPQISISTGQVTGVEALLRLRSKRLGLVMPDEFIPLAEETGQIVPIGAWVARNACLAARQIQLEIGRPIIMAVNLSPRQFQQEELATVIEEALRESGLDPACLELELTEGIPLSESPKSMEILAQLRALGVRIAIDDFGTGYSSMSYVLRLNVDRLKVDRSFVRDIATDPNRGAFARAIIGLAHGMNIPVVAEGVESSEARDMLHLEGCDEGQGYYYSQPVPIEALALVVETLELSTPSAAKQRVSLAVLAADGDLSLTEIIDRLA